MKLIQQLFLLKFSCLVVLFSSCGTTNSYNPQGNSQSQVGELAFDAKERQIISQARGGGAIIGGLIGMAIGDNIGKKRANQARQMRLNNDALRGLIASARVNNARLEAYNKRVAQRITQLRNADDRERSKLAKAERISVDRAIAKTDQMIRQREAARSKLTESQASELSVEIRKAKTERAKLASHRTKLSEYERVAAQ